MYTLAFGNLTLSSHNTLLNNFSPLMTILAIHFLKKLVRSELQALRRPPPPLSLSLSVKILKAKTELQGSDVFIWEFFSSYVRGIRRKFVPHLKKARIAGKRATMVFDHIIIEGKKFTVDEKTT